jgi:hypothetical protein
MGPNLKIDLEARLPPLTHRRGENSGTIGFSQTPTFRTPPSVWIFAWRFDGLLILEGTGIRRWAAISICPRGR